MSSEPTIPITPAQQKLGQKILKYQLQNQIRGMRFINSLVFYESFPDYMPTAGVVIILTHNTEKKESYCITMAHMWNQLDPGNKIDTSIDTVVFKDIGHYSLQQFLHDSGDGGEYAKLISDAKRRQISEEVLGLQELITRVFVRGQSLSELFHQMTEQDPTNPCAEYYNKLKAFVGDASLSPPTPPKHN